MTKKPNVYSFNDEYYVSLGDYKKRQNNWNELKKWLETTNTGVGSRKYILEEILNKMQELESGKQ